MIRPASVLTAFAVIILTASSTFAQGMPGYIPPAVTRSQNVVNYRVNHHGPSWNDRQPIEAFLSQLGQRSWFRMEYLHWDVEGLGRGAPGFSPRRGGRASTDPPVGETVFFGDIPGAPVDNESAPFFYEQDLQVFAEGEPEFFFDEDLLGAAFIPSLASLSLNGAPGVRGTYGIWMDGGSLEFNVFGGGNNDRFSVSDLTSQRVLNAQIAGTSEDPGIGTLAVPNIAIPFEIGADFATNPLFGFDDSYRMSIDSSYWGSELNLLSQPISAASPIQMQWLGGFRYFSYDERFRQFGSASNGGAESLRSLNVRSSTVNNTYGPTIGFRSLVDSKYVTLSVTPRVSFALNNYTAKGTSVFSQAGELAPAVDRFKVDEVDFTTVAQVSFLAELHLSEYLTVHGGYDFLWSYKVARAFNQPVYGTGVTDGDAVPAVGFRDNPEDLLIDGLSFGATWRF